MSENIWNRLLLSTDIKLPATKLQKSNVLVVGNGALGSDIALKIAGCKVSKLTLVDGDIVSAANIPHSSIFRINDVGMSKTEVLSRFLLEKFQELKISQYSKFIQQCDEEIFADQDLIVCAPDNDQTRLWVNYYAVKYKTAAIFAGVSGPKSEWMGYTFVYKPNTSACFNCFAVGGQSPSDVGLSLEKLETSDNSIEENRNKCGGENIPVPMIAPIIGVIASFTAVTSLRVLLSIDDVKAYTYINLKAPSLMTTEITPIPTCAVCGKITEFDIVEQLGKK